MICRGLGAILFGDVILIFDVGCWSLKINGLKRADLNFVDLGKGYSFVIYHRSNL